MTDKNEMVGQSAHRDKYTWDSARWFPEGTMPNLTEYITNNGTDSPYH